MYCFACLSCIAKCNCFPCCQPLQCAFPCHHSASCCCWACTAHSVLYNILSFVTYCFVLLLLFATSLNGIVSFQQHSHRYNVLNRGSEAVPQTSQSRNHVFEDVQLGPLLGKGGYGKVYRGLWNGVPVAVKVLDALFVTLCLVLGQACACVCKAVRSCNSHQVPLYVSSQFQQAPCSGWRP